MCAEPPLFDLQLHDEGGEHECDRDTAEDSADADDRAEQRQENAAVYGMSHERVGSSLNHVVVHLESDATAPILTQVESRPDCDAQSDDGQTQADGDGDSRLWPQKGIGRTQAVSGIG